MSVRLEEALSRSFRGPYQCPAGARPNILWIVSDQLRADHVGFGGNAIVRTPNLDGLAARARVFDNAWVANPICMPNRCSMLTGRMPTAHGVIFNDRSLPPNANTFARQLTDAGYATALIGKAHIQHGLSRNVVREQRQPPTLFSPYPDGWDELENPENYLVENPSITDFYGFGHVEFAIGHGDSVAGHHYQWALHKGARPEQLNTAWGTDTQARERYPGWWQVYQSALPEEFHSTAFVTERTIAWLEAHAGSGAAEKPFFLQCSFPDPHHPFSPPGDWWRAYRPEDMPLPETFSDPLDNGPAHLRIIRQLKPGKNPVQMFGPTEDLVRHALAAEYGLIEMMDRGIGRVLQRLSELGLADDTIVVFTSDHGDMFGDHGLMLKATMHYQGCLRVPLLVAVPGMTPGHTNAFASSLDLAQTFLDFAATPTYQDMQGVSLKPVAENVEASVRDHAYVEEDFPLALHGSPLPLKSRTLLYGGYRYSRYSSGDCELYDLTQDPNELRNLANATDARSIRAEMAERMLDVMTSLTPMETLG
ncbi:MAG: sulfatase-like hydrolase/transferase [Pseudomonadales bacterium]